jgi:hypothetical protein
VLRRILYPGVHLTVFFTRGRYRNILRHGVAGGGGSQEALIDFFHGQIFGYFGILKVKIDCKCLYMVLK